MRFAMPDACCLHARVAHLRVLHQDAGMNDPNFPPNLHIKPLHLRSQADPAADEEQRDAIARYGIAGRVW